jgi:protein TonB
VEDIPISIAEVMPEYPGGMKSLYKDLAKKLSRNTTGMGGKVYVEFIVEKDGSISNVKIKGGLNEILDQQSVEAVKSLKNWTPGEQNYHKVRVKMVLPINYIIRS